MKETTEGKWSWVPPDAEDGDADRAGGVAAPEAPEAPDDAEAAEAADDTGPSSWRQGESRERSVDEPTTLEAPAVRATPPRSAPVGSSPPATSSPLPATARGPRLLAVAAIAALVGALAGGGVAALVAGNDDDVRPAPVVPKVEPNTSRITRPQDIQAILSKVQPGVVSIRTEAFQEGQGLFDINPTPTRGAGTGMVVSAEGEILTNAHVVNGATSIRVTLYGETEARPADLVGADPDADVAIVKLRNTDGMDGRPVKLGSSEKMLVGDAVLAIGNALALPGGPTVTLGIVSAKDRSLGAGNERLTSLIQTDAAINRGNSGGPLVNSAGEVIGMNTAVIQSAGESAVQNIGFAIAIDTVKPMLGRLREGAAAPAQGFLGVSTVTLTPEIRERFAFVPETGAIVVEVVPGSPADSAGLLRNDVVTTLAGEDIASNADLQAAVRKHKPGDKVELVSFRGQNERTATVELGARPVGGG